MSETKTKKAENPDKPMSTHPDTAVYKTHCNVCFKYDEHKLFDEIMTFVYQVPDILYRLTRTNSDKITYPSTGSLLEISSNSFDFICPLKMIEMKSFQNFERITRLLLDKKMGCCAICNYLAFILLRLKKEVSTLLTYNTVVYTCQECKKRVTYANQCACQQYSRTDEFVPHTSLKGTQENKIRWGESALFQLENKILYLITNRILPHAYVIEGYTDIMGRKIVSDSHILPDTSLSAKRRIRLSKSQGSKSTQDVTLSKLRRYNKSDDKYAITKPKPMLKSFSDDAFNMTGKTKEEKSGAGPRTSKICKSTTESISDRDKSHKSSVIGGISPKSNIGDGFLGKGVLTTKGTVKLTPRDQKVQQYDRKENMSGRQNETTRIDTKDANHVHEKNASSRKPPSERSRENYKNGTSRKTPRHGKENLNNLGNNIRREKETKQTTFDGKYFGQGQGFKKQHDKTRVINDAIKCGDSKKYASEVKPKVIYKEEANHDNQTPNTKHKGVSKGDAKLKGEIHKNRDLTKGNVKELGPDHIGMSRDKEGIIIQKVPIGQKHDQKDFFRDKKEKLLKDPTQNHKDTPRKKKSEQIKEASTNQSQAKDPSSKNRVSVPKDGKKHDKSPKDLPRNKKGRYEDSREIELSQKHSSLDQKKGSPKDHKDSFRDKKERIKDSNLCHNDSYHNKKGELTLEDTREAQGNSSRNKREGSVKDYKKHNNVQKNSSINKKHTDHSRNITRALSNDQKEQNLSEKDSSPDKQVLVAKEDHVGSSNVRNTTPSNKKVDFPREKTTRQNRSQQSTEKNKILQQSKQIDKDKYSLDIGLSGQATLAYDHNYNASSNNKKDRYSYGDLSNVKFDKLNKDKSDSEKITPKNKLRLLHKTAKDKINQSLTHIPQDKENNITSEESIKNSGRGTVWGKKAGKVNVIDTDSASLSDFNMTKRATKDKSARRDDLYSSPRSIEGLPLNKKNKRQMSSLIHDSNRSKADFTANGKKNLHRDKSSRRFHTSPTGDNNEELPAIHEKKLSFIPHEGGGGIHYELSNGKFINLGWTKMPTAREYRWVPIFKSKPAHPERSLFQRFRGDVLYYSTGEVLARVYDNADGYVYYKNGSVALSFYRYRNRYRYAIFSPGMTIYKGHVRPATLLAAFDNIGNGVVYDEQGQVRIRYNQYEGQVVDRVIATPRRWLWRHQSKKRRRMQEILVNEELLPPDVTLTRLYTNYLAQSELNGQHSTGERPHTPSSGLLQDKNDKLTEQVPIQNVYCKINDWFSLKVFSQEDIKVVFREGATSHTFAVGVTLYPKIKGNRLIQRDSVSCGYYAEPPRTNSLADLYGIVHKQRLFIERIQLIAEAAATPRRWRKLQSGSAPDLVVS